MRKEPGETMPEQTLDVGGVRVLPGWLARSAQDALAQAVLALLADAPAVAPQTRFGPMSVRMTSAGDFGWVADRRGYRYEPVHPLTGRPWPPIPPLARDVWDAVVPGARAPECCLVNLYDHAARMGLHQDRDEQDLAAPVVSVSLGDDALFRLGGLTRSAPTRSMVLRSGDVVVLGGDSRLRFHGVDRILPGTSDLMPGGGRINLTLRRVTLPAG
jgi:alkylated DNA repair protein (DNA oxidative demethylase)